MISFAYIFQFPTNLHLDRSFHDEDYGCIILLCHILSLIPCLSTLLCGTYIINRKSHIFMIDMLGEA